MIGIGVLAVSLFATSFVFGFLFLLAFAGFRLFSQRTYPLHLSNAHYKARVSRLNPKQTM